MKEWLIEAYNSVWFNLILKILGIVIGCVLTNILRKWWMAKENRWEDFKTWWGNHINIFKLINKVKFYEKQINVLNNRLCELTKIITIDEIQVMFERDHKNIPLSTIYMLWYDENFDIRPYVRYKGKLYNRPIVYDLMMAAITEDDVFEKNDLKDISRDLDCKDKCLRSLDAYDKINDLLEERITENKKDIHHMLNTYDEYKDNLKQLKKSASEDPSLIE